MLGWNMHYQLSREHERDDLVTNDPAAMEPEKSELFGGSSVAFAKSAFEACGGSDALLILTERREFRKINLKLVRKMLRLSLIIDGRNLLAAEEVEAAGLVYCSMGRRASLGQPSESAELRAKAATASLSRLNFAVFQLSSVARKVN
jgi:hypothetical protein